MLMSFIGLLENVVCCFLVSQCVQEMGNAKAKRLYEAFLPECFQRPETDHSAEIFIRDKYDKKKYMDKVIDIQMLRVSPHIEMEREKSFVLVLQTGSADRKSGQDS